MATEAVIQRTGRSATVMEAGDGFHSVHWEIVAVAAIAVVAGFLRFYNLPSQGLIYWDEGKFALEGVRFAALAQHLGSTTLAGLAGKPAGTAKPGHALILGLAFLVLGIHDYSPLMADALAST